MSGIAIRSMGTAPGSNVSGLHPLRITTCAEDTAADAAPGSNTLSFEWVVDRYESPLLRYAAGLMSQAGATEDVQDVVQDALLRLHTQWTTHGRDSVEHLPTWLYRVTRNRAMDVLRQRTARRRFTLRWRQQATQAYIAPTPGEQSETLATTRRVLRDMPDSQRELLLLKAEHNLSIRQMAQVLEQPHSTVAYQLNQALAELARRLKEQGAI